GCPQLSTKADAGSGFSVAGALARCYAQPVWCRLAGYSASRAVLRRPSLAQTHIRTRRRRRTQAGKLLINGVRVMKKQGLTAFFQKVKFPGHGLARLGEPLSRPRSRLPGEAPRSVSYCRRRTRRDSP